MKSFRNILWGLVFIVIGIIFGLNALNITNIDIFFEGWWTLFIIVPCFVDLFKDESKTGNIIGLLIGIVLLLSCQNILDFNLVWKLVAPVALVIIGLSLIFKDTFRREIKKEINKLNKPSNKVYSATFGGQDLNFDNEEFTGCELNAIFGGVKCDLRNAKIKQDVVINTSSIFGGIDILVPTDVKVKIISTPIFGGVDNKYTNNLNEKAKTIYINSTCIFGGVEIK